MRSCVRACVRACACVCACVCVCAWFVCKNYDISKITITNNKREGMGEGLARAHESASAIKKTIGWEWLEARHGRMRVPVLKKKIGLEWVRARHEGVSAIIIKIKINKK